MPVRSPRPRPARRRQQKALPARPASARQRALALLARREHSAAELTAKLAGRGLPEPQAAQLVAQLASEGLQSDLRFAESFARSRAEKWGRPRILRELAARGIDPQTAAAGLEAALADDASQDESERALAVLQRRFAAAAGDPRLRQRQWRFLQARGFAADAAAKALRAFAEQPENTGRR